MSDENLIEPNEEIRCFIGMAFGDACDLLADADIETRVIRPGTIGTFAMETTKLNRVNLVVDVNGIVTAVYYG